MIPMSFNFRAMPDPSAEIVGRVSSLTPENPFHTFEYIDVRRRLGADPWLLWIEDTNGCPVTGCSAFLMRGRMNSRLEITSLPSPPDKDQFWQGMFDFCRINRVTVLSVYTFGSAETVIELRKDRILHKRRGEYRLDLTVPDLWAVTNRRHHRLIKKARAAGLSLTRSSDDAARKTHIELANMALDRHRGRGESIDYAIDVQTVNAFIDCGAGEMFQAVRDGRVLSTILVARSRTGGYGQSSGTSPEGRDIGSSHFLFYETACVLKSEGVELFNLGGADEHSTGLQEFKLGLGSKRVELESAEFYTGGALRRLATNVIGRLTGPRG